MVQKVLRHYWGFVFLGDCSFFSLLLILFQKKNLVLLNNEGMGNDITSEVVIFAFCLVWSMIGILGMKYKSKLFVFLSIILLLLCLGYLSIATFNIGWNFFHFYFGILVIYGVYYVKILHSVTQE